MFIKNVFQQYGLLHKPHALRDVREPLSPLIMMLSWRMAMLALLSLLMLACSSNEGEWKRQIGESLYEAETGIANLKRSINNGSIRNTIILEQYAKLLREQKPDLSALANALSKDARANGPMYTSLLERLNSVKKTAKSVPKKGEKAVLETLTELESIINASSPVLFGLMLSDPINVLADMSGGRLARVESMSKTAEKSANKSGDYGSASKLVGNPQYGSWQTNSSGNTVWKWIAAYAVFNTMFNQPVYYDRWSYNRPYSYYHDYGRRHYTSPKSFQSQRKVQQATTSKFKSQGKTFNSPYAKRRSGGSSTESVTRRATKSNRFSNGFASSKNKTGFGNKSSYAKNSSGTKKKSGSFSSSQRSSSYKTSRSFGGGK